MREQGFALKAAKVRDAVDIAQATGLVPANRALDVRVPQDRALELTLRAHARAFRPRQQPARGERAALSLAGRSQGELLAVAGVQPAYGIAGGLNGFAGALQPL